jgi:hypothetical protein
MTAKEPDMFVVLLMSYTMMKTRAPNMLCCFVNKLYDDES